MATKKSRPYDPARATKPSIVSTTPSGELVISMEIQGRMRLTLAVLELANLGIWFAVCPIGNHVYTLSVLETYQDWLQSLLNEVNAGTS